MAVGHAQARYLYIETSIPLHQDINTFTSRHNPVIHPVINDLRGTDIVSYQHQERADRGAARAKRLIVEGSGRA